MDGQLRPGTVITTQAQISYRVVSLLGAGGQGEVYDVEAGGQHKALKWYFSGSALPQQLEILTRLVELGTPDSSFLWPEDLALDPQEERFGYIMGLRPKNYKGLQDLLKCRIDPTFEVLCRTAFNLVRAYEKLHSKGNCYRDISFGNLFFDPETGDVLICDNDNVAPRDMPGLVMGTPRFMAPEIVRGEAKPSRYTDQFSLAVLLFYIFMVAHPLDGKREAQIKCYDIPAQNKLYGTDPLFIFDPNDDSNRPVPGIQDNALIYWPMYPQELKDLFTESFTVGLMNPNKRVTENRWLAVLGNMLSGIVHCPKCGAEIFFDNAHPSASRCWHCNGTVAMPTTLVIGKRRVLLQPDAILPTYQIDGRYDTEDAAGRVVRNPKNPALLGLRNESKDNWTYIKTDGSHLVVAPGKTAGIAKGAKIDFGVKTGEFE